MQVEAELLKDLNDAQKIAVTHGEGPLLIVAGAGTGKTTVLTRRYLWLLKEKKLEPENMLALTFTEKAAGEMEDRILSMLPNGTYDFWISTFHGFCQRVLEERGLEIGLPNRFKLIDETEGWLLLKRRLDELPLKHYRPLGNPVKFLSALQTHISRAKDENVNPEEYDEFVKSLVLDGDSELVNEEKTRLQELADLFFSYRKILRDEGALDFGDLIQETLRLFRERPHVLAEYRARFPYILVDEFQDTNWAQYELVRLLAGDQKNLTVVGDDDQAIYKFRGASLANILQFRDDYPESKAVYLTDNYRSYQEILDLAYACIKQNNPNRLEIKLADTGLQKSLKASRGTGGRIDVSWYRSLEDEARAVADQIRTQKDSDTSLTWNDIAILVRSNDGAEPFVRALEAEGIPFRFFALRGLYIKPIIIDITSYLSVVNDQHDSVHLWRLLNLACYDMAAKDIAALSFAATKLRGMHLWEALKLAAANPEMSDAGKRKAAIIISHIEALAETARREPPLKILQLVLDKTGLLTDILSQTEREKIEQIEWLNGFASRIKRYESNAHSPSLNGFLNEFQLEVESGEEGALRVNPDEGPELVKILTIHGSKGLEFRHVFLVSMVDQRFPTRKRSEAIPLPDGLVKERLSEGDAHLEEERRLFYVALTRARDSITLTGAEDYGGTRKKKPSSFLDEAGLETPKAGERPDTDSLTLSIAKPELGFDEIREYFPLKRRFSYTQLAAFSNCPLQYKFAHVYRIPILGSYQKSFGQSMHLALHDILKLHLDRGRMKQGDLFSPVPSTSQRAGTDRQSGTQPAFHVTKDEAEEIYRSRWIDEWYPDRATHDRHFKEGMDAIRKFWGDCHVATLSVKHLELPFDWRLGEHSLKGAIDRIDEAPDGAIAIIDYKTGRAKESDALTSDDKKQLRIYQLAMEEKGHRVSSLRLHYVLEGVSAEVDLLEGEEKIDFKNKLMELMQAILVSEFPASPSQFICRYCDFRNICEFRKL